MIPAQSFRTILVVDDEPCVLHMLELVLSSRGYAVLTADCAEAALRVGEAHPGPVDLLLADVVMPGASGPALADAFSRMHPEARVLFMAGLPDSAEVIDRIVAPGRPFLPKPFRPSTLLEYIARVLDAPQVRAAGI